MCIHDFLFDYLIYIWSICYKEGIVLTNTHT